MSTNVIGCTVFIDGAPISDGCSVTRADAPAVLSGLRVVWGRTGSVDQATASTCTFAIDDPLTGDRLVPSLTIGRRVDVQADTIVYPNPDQPTLDGLYPGPVSNVAGVTGSGTDQNEVLGGPEYRAATIVYPPRPYSQSPTAWDDVPRTLPGQPWALSASLAFPAEFAGWRAYAARIQPVAFTSPAGPGLLLPDNATLSPDATSAELLFTPPPGVWLGLQVTIYPASPRWDDLDGTSWADLGSDPPLPSIVGFDGPVQVTGNTRPVTTPAATRAGDTVWVMQAGIGGMKIPDLLKSPPWSVVKAINTAGNCYWTIYRKTATVDGAETINLFTETWTGAATGYLLVTRGHGTPVWSAATEVPTDTANSLPGIAAPRSGRRVTIAAGRVGSTTARATVTAGATRAGTTRTDGNAALQWLHTDDRVTAAGPAVPVTLAWPPAGTRGGGGITLFLPDLDPPPTVDTSWDDLTRFEIADVELLAPPEGAASSGLVFSGRITDVAAEWDGGASARVSVIAQDWLAELANRFVGDQPWPEEPLGTRAQRIVALSGQPIALKVDPIIDALQVTYRDVDRQPAANLLQQLAQSGAGILWTATHLVTGQTMWIENTAARPAALTLTDAGTGLVHVVPAAGAIGHALPISACNVEADPIRFGLDMSDTVSEVALTWKEQVTDDGVIKPADRTVTERDVTTEQIIGARRLAVSTQLSREADAEAQAQLWLARRSPLGWRVEGLVWDTSLRPGLSPDDTQTVMTLLDGMRRIGLPIALTDMPEWTWPISGGAGEVALYVEGGTYDYRAGSWVLELNTSSATASAVGSLPWTALDAGWAWDEFDPAVTWLDLFGVTYPDA